MVKSLALGDLKNHTMPLRFASGLLLGTWWFWDHLGPIILTMSLIAVSIYTTWGVFFFFVPEISRHTLWTLPDTCPTLIIQPWTVHTPANVDSFKHAFMLFAILLGITGNHGRPQRCVHVLPANLHVCPLLQNYKLTPTHSSNHV